MYKLALNSLGHTAIKVWGTLDSLGLNETLRYVTEPHESTLQFPTEGALGILLRCDHKRHKVSLRPWYANTLTLQHSPAVAARGRKQWRPLNNSMCHAVVRGKLYVVLAHSIVCTVSIHHCLCSECPPGASTPQVKTWSRNLRIVLLRQLLKLGIPCVKT